MSIIDTLFIFLYILCGYAAFVFAGNHFGRNAAVAGFFLGYLLAWGAKRLILRIVFSKTSSRRNKKPASGAGKVDGQKQN
jgi:membrane associated rhomboid family serine protease